MAPVENQSSSDTEIFVDKPLPKVFEASGRARLERGLTMDMLHREPRTFKEIRSARYCALAWELFDADYWDLSSDQIRWLDIAIIDEMEDL